MEKKPNGELYKIQFKKAITLVGFVTYDPDLKMFHIVGNDKKNRVEVNSWVSPADVSLLEDANETEKRKFEKYQSEL